VSRAGAASQGDAVSHGGASRGTGVVKIEVEEAVLVDDERARTCDLDRLREQGRVGHHGVELALLAAGVDPGRLELADQPLVEASAEEALVEPVGVHRDDGGLHASREELGEQRAARLPPERQTGVEAGQRADPFDPVTVRLQVDVAEHADLDGVDVAQLGERVEESGFVTVPGRGAADERQAGQMP